MTPPRAWVACALALAACSDPPRRHRDPVPWKEVVFDLRDLPEPGDGQYVFEWLLPAADGALAVVPGLSADVPWPLPEPGVRLVRLDLPEDYRDHQGELGLLLSFEDAGGLRHPLLGAPCAYQCGIGNPIPLAEDAPFALGLAFADQSGRVTVDTPTTADPDDRAHGVWAWSADEPDAPGLATDPPTAGWSWVAWLVDGDDARALGVVSDPAAPDSDGAGPTAGPEPAPPFPGQDLVDPPILVSTGRYVLSLEPGPPGSAPWLPVLEAPLDGAGWIALRPLPTPSGEVTLSDPIR